MLTAAGWPTEDVFQVIFSTFRTSHTHTTIPAGSAALQAWLFCAESHPVKYPNYNEHAINDHLRKVVSNLNSTEYVFFWDLKPFNFYSACSKRPFSLQPFPASLQHLIMESHNSLGWKEP